MVKVSKTVSMDLDLIIKVLEKEPNLSKAVNEALALWLATKS